MGCSDLAVGILQDISQRSLQYAGTSAVGRKARGMASKFGSGAAGFDADQAHGLVLLESAEDADRVRSSADTGDDRRGKLSRLLDHLPPGFGANHRLEVAHHARIGIGAESAAEQVISVADIGDPIAQAPR